MKYSFEVRQATTCDAQAISQITRESFTKYAQLAGIEPTLLTALTETIDDIKSDIENKIVLVAFTDGEPVGSVRIELDEALHTAYLSRFGVRLNSQNNGIGKSIMNLVDIMMREHGIEHIQLHTGSKISPLIRFYYGRGFYIESTSTDRGYIRAALRKDYI